MVCEYGNKDRMLFLIFRDQRVQIILDLRQLLNTADLDDYSVVIFSHRRNFTEIRFVHHWGAIDYALDDK